MHDFKYEIEVGIKLIEKVNLLDFGEGTETKTGTKFKIVFDSWKENLDEPVEAMFSKALKSIIRYSKKGEMDV